jgi:hypothetical protein
VAEIKNATLPRLSWLRGADGEVEGFKAKLWTRFCGRQCGGERVRAHRRGGGKGGTGFSVLEPTEGGEGNGGARCVVAAFERVVG